LKSRRIATKRKRWRCTNRNIKKITKVEDEKTLKSQNDSEHMETRIKKTSHRD
jgi:hypothetical protein